MSAHTFITKAIGDQIPLFESTRVWDPEYEPSPSDAARLKATLAEGAGAMAELQAVALQHGVDFARELSRG